MAEIQTLDDDDISNNIEFLTQLEFAESQASLSLSTKRRRITPSSSPPPPPTQPLEGAYTAALRGSKSLTWKTQSQIHAPSPPSRAGTGAGGGGGNGGACFKCGKEGHWARDCDVSPSGMGVGGGEKSCPCGMGSCFVLTANTERNRGRKFFRCPVRQENGGCGFFEWCDDSSGVNSSTEDRGWKNGVQEPFHKGAASQGTSGMTKPWNEYDKGSNSLNSSYGNSFQKSNTIENKGYSMRSGSSCFKCGEEGHWARDCPATSSNATTAGATAKTSSSYDTCYKCGGSGHWARDCSQGQGQGQSTKLRNW